MALISVQRVASWGEMEGNIAAGIGGGEGLTKSLLVAVMIFLREEIIC